MLVPPGRPHPHIPLHLCPAAPDTEKRPAARVSPTVEGTLPPTCRPVSPRTPVVWKVTEVSKSKPIAPKGKEASRTGSNPRSLL